MAEPIPFRGHNRTFSHVGPELPAHYSEQHGVLTTCWQLTAAEAQEIARTGRVWIQWQGRDQRPVPIRIDTKRPYEVDDESEGA